MAEDTKTEMVLAAAEKALKPVADMVFNDNGDMTVSSAELEYDQIVAAYFAHRSLAARPSADKAEGVGAPAAHFCGPYGVVERRDIEEWSEPTRSWGLSCPPLYAAGTDPAIARLAEELAEARENEAHWRKQASDARVDRDIAVSKQDTLRAITHEAQQGWKAANEATARAETALAQRDADIAKAVEDALLDVAETTRQLSHTQETGSMAWTVLRQTEDAIRRAALRASSATQTDGGSAQPTEAVAERNRIIVHVREMIKRFEKGSASQNNFKALADMLERGDPLARGRTTQADGGGK